MAIKTHLRTRYLDLETEGLGSHFWEKQWQKMDATLRKRARQGVPRITEIAFLGEAGKGVFGFTDIYNQDLFHRHNVTSKKLRDPKSVLPSSFYREVIGESGPAKADPSVAIPGSVLNRGIRRHGRWAVRGKVQPTASLIDQVLGRLEQDVQSGPINLTGWNITGFDLPVLLGNSTPDQVKRLTDMVRGGSVRIEEAAKNYHRTMFNRMLRGEYTPVVTHHAALQAAKGKPILDPSEIGKFTKKHQGLVDFMADVKGGKSAFELRMNTWAQKFKGSAYEGQSQKIAAKVARRLSKVKDFDSYLNVVRRSQLAAGSKMTGWFQSFFEVAGEVYRRPDMPHAHIFGDIKRARGEVSLGNKKVAKMTGGTMAGKVHALQFVMGGQQEEVAASLLKAMQETDPKDPRVAQLQRALRGAHSGSRDTRTLEIITKALEPKPENQKLLQAFENIHFDNDNLTRMYHKRVSQISDEFHTLEKVQEIFANNGRQTSQAARQEGTKAAERRGFLTSTITRLKNFVAPPGATRGGIAARTGVLVAGAALLYNMLGPGKKEDEKAERIHKARMQGIRRPRNPNQMISGINPSEMDYANVSSFHSGANIWEGMMTASSMGKEWHNPFVGGRPVDPELEAMAEMGDIVHEYWQDKLLSAGFFQSAETPVWAFGMSGVVDAIATGGIPVEIKTVSDDKRLMSLRKPREKDVGQINFDMSATNAPYGYVLYASREDPLKAKLFRIIPDMARLSRDIELQQIQMAADPRIEEGHLFNPSEPSASYLHRKMLGGHAAVWRRGDPFEITKFFSMNLANTMLGINTAPEITGEDPFDGMQESTTYAGSYNLDLEIPQHRDYTTASNHPLAMSQSANLSKVRDYKTQLQHLPGLPRTFRSRNTRPNMASLTEF